MPDLGARVPKYDFHCGDCGHQFELTRSFARAGEPAHCPLDGATATRRYTPPMDVLVYRREPAAPTGTVAIPPGALSCHDHGPPPGTPGSAPSELGSRWHARGYDPSDDELRAQRHWHSHEGGLRHAHPHSHRHHHGYGR
jgi:putative FmdB family regulatory protein